jgi:maleamate amidohydrolase
VSGLEADYETAGFGRSLGFGRRPALLVVDVARAYLVPSSPLYAGVEDAVASTRRLLAAARETGAPVYITAVRYAPGGVDGGRFFERVAPLACFVEGNPLGELAEGIEPRAGETLVVKQYPSAFFGTSLAASLTARGVDSVVICGLTTSGCVRASAVDALCHGFTPIVVRDAVGDRHPSPHEANLFDLQAKYADVVSEAEAIAGLQSASSTTLRPQGTP